MMQQATEATIGRVLAAAERVIDVEKVATGAAKENGLGPAFRMHGLLDFVVQDLGRFPGHGVGFVVAALKSPVIRGRNMAVRALAAWGAERWTPEVGVALEAAVACEPKADTRARMARVLGGGGYDDAPEDVDAADEVERG